MGGPCASDDLDLGAQTQVWLATGDDPEATRTGRYLYHRRPYAAHPAASEILTSSCGLVVLRNETAETIPRRTAVAAAVATRAADSSLLARGARTTWRCSASTRSRSSGS
jgi:hypothetical protein